MKSSIEGIRDPRCRMYDVLVRYRTRSGCNAKAVQVAAMSHADALAIAGAKVARQRGVIRIDECNVTTSWNIGSGTW